MSNDNCIFCKIADKKIESFILLETDHAVAFLDIRPLTRGETLVVPKMHRNGLDDQWESDLDSEIMFLSRKVAVALQKAFDYTTVLFHAVNGVGQEVPHFHMHIYGARKKDDPIYADTIQEGELNAELEQTRELLKPHLEY